MLGRVFDPKAELTISAGDRPHWSQTGAIVFVSKQFDSWLHYSAFRINQEIGERGHFWQTEPFDHLVRSVKQYEYLRDYIANNPRKARLKEGECIYRRYPG